MPDRDGKFVKELQITFESSLWELYVHAVLKELNYETDFRHSSPDFSVVAPFRFTIEATVTRPEFDGKSPVGWSIQDIPTDFTAFNNDATLRLCNSIKQKLEKFRSSYSCMPHVSNLPFVLAIGAYDRPGSHLAASRPIIAALYGVYHDEQAAINGALSSVPAYEVDGATKKNGTNVQLGLFNDAGCSEISAVVYSCLATWGKVRALAKNPRYNLRFTSFHPNAESIYPKVFETAGATYPEQLCDGLYVFRNPYAKNPLPVEVFDHPRIAKSIALPRNNFDFECPDDFLLARFVRTTKLPT
ncbi:MAG: glycosaminoglycan attachment site [Haliea sp.]|nr:glycosaminoglycan attachment site [Haliea sp.]